MTSKQFTLIFVVSWSKGGIATPKLVANNVIVIVVVVVVVVVVDVVVKIIKKALTTARKFLFCI
jgi:hypothetical protein